MAVKRAKKLSKQEYDNVKIIEKRHGLIIEQKTKIGLYRAESRSPLQLLYPVVIQKKSQKKQVIQNYILISLVLVQNLLLQKRNNKTLHLQQILNLNTAKGISTQLKVLSFLNKFRFLLSIYIRRQILWLQEFFANRQYIY